MKLRTKSLLSAAAVAVALSLSQAQGAAPVPAGITAAIADAARPDADKARDADRRPGEVIAFSGMKQGDRVADLLPGGGYFTRLFSKVVGAKGVVYALPNPRPATAPAGAPDPAAAVTAIAADPAFANVKVGSLDPSTKMAEPMDVIWTSLNYHDMQNRPNADLAAFNKYVFDSLKPGGSFIVIDHAAEKGSGKRDTSALHRIDPDFVKAEVLAAGFTFGGESNVLANPADDHKAVNRESGIRGKTDQFVFKFTKPGK
jgi:predicted methyltransferase